jgi:hypothetical protein
MSSPRFAKPHFVKPQGILAYIKFTKAFCLSRQILILLERIVAKGLDICYKAGWILLGLIPNRNDLGFLHILLESCKSIS